MPDDMTKPIAMPDTVAAHRTLPAMLAAAVVGIVLAGTAALWVHYGTAVFFETIRSGFAACFG
jgi:hypothetical protein